MQPEVPSLATIVVIDDDPELRVVLADILTDAGFSVATANDGESALVLLQSIAVDLILVDSSMPGMTGEEFIERWRIDPRSGAPVVLMTGFESADTLPDGCAKVLKKVFSASALLSTVRELLERRSS